MIRLTQVKCPIDHSEDLLYQKVKGLLKLNNEPFSLKIKRCSLDARKKPELFYVYTLDVFLDKSIENKLKRKVHSKDILFMEEEIYHIPDCGNCELSQRPVIVGSGPAGLFCAYLLAQKGFRPIVLERGESIDNRTKRVKAFWDGSEKLDNNSNVQFGEGGAGTFSDGKLNTLVKDKAFRNQYVLDTFVRFGAKKEIAYLNKPHIGTDCLCSIIPAIRNEIIRLGGDFIFSAHMCKMNVEQGKLSSVDFELLRQDEASSIRTPDIQIGLNRINTQICVLAIGHSSRDTFEMLKSMDIAMQQKNFAVGFRIEHPQEMINASQYGAPKVLGLGAADYKLTHQCKNGRSVYSFCMCPGGHVVNASSEDNRLAINGMSYSSRDSENANSAIIVSVDRKDFGSDDVLAGLQFQKRLEELAYTIGQGAIPNQLFRDYENRCLSDAYGDVSPCGKGERHFADLNALLDGGFHDAIVEAIYAFDRSIKGFSRGDAILSGIESRTSSPVRILRDENYNSSIAGLYPCGEGAGYAGGITSAAMDGMKVAEVIIEKYCFSM